MQEKQIEARKWLLTINNPLPKGLTHEAIKNKISKWKSLQYYCMSDELAGMRHTHLYMLFSSPIRFSTIKKQFPEAHIEKAYGKSSENRAYVFKEGKKWEKSPKKKTNLADTHEEWGEMPFERQGARNDLIDMYDMINSGMRNFEILEERPTLISQIDRMDKVRQIVRAEEYKNVFRQLTVVYIWGDTSTGKTQSVLETYGYQNVYRITNYKNPYDDYKGQDIICYDEFRSQIAIEEMLILLEGYPCNLPCRYFDRAACYTKVYIISNIDLLKQYQDVQKNSPQFWNSFLQRIQTVRVHKDGKIEEYSMAEYLNAFHEPSSNELHNVHLKKTLY